MANETDNTELIHELLNSFQEVLNWCYDIDDDDSRLPLDTLERAHKAINAGTQKFQPEMTT